MSEVPNDWLWPHTNDDGEWLTRYGAAICVRRSDQTVIEDVQVRSTQNGILVESSNGVRVVGCDASFLSGWGLALWRSNECIVWRNAFDYCIRGYEHDKWNRGQDSAGILMFEECTKNVFFENSATHGGDGFFGFTGRDALGQNDPDAAPDAYRLRGHRLNVIADNDFSFAAAHGLELTFSFANVIRGNRFEGNAICGIWGGYSQRTWIEGNRFIGNGKAGVGAERGGINIEHGVGNAITENHFTGNTCAIALWTDDDPHLAPLPWTRANGPGGRGEAIHANLFKDNDVTIETRNMTSVLLDNNAIEGDEDGLSSMSIDGVVGAIQSIGPPDEVVRFPPGDVPDVKAIGAELRAAYPDVNSPVGARKAFGGRESIRVGQWGPLDPSVMTIRRGRHSGFFHQWLIERGFHASVPRAADGPNAADANQIRVEAAGDVRVRQNDNAITVSPNDRHRATPYVLRVTFGDGSTIERRGLLLRTRWNGLVFPNPAHPIDEEDAWRNGIPNAGPLEVHIIDMQYHFGAGGPSDVMMSPIVTSSKLDADNFGLRTSLTSVFPAGTYRLRTVSDDGIRVLLDDEVLLEDWTHHAAKRNDAVFTVREERELVFELEYFELDGAATLTVDFDPVTLPDFEESP